MAGMAAFASLRMNSIVSVWIFLLTLGSGLGSVAVARWIWWRVNATSELSALVASTALSLWVVSAGVPKAEGILWVAFGSMAVWIPLALFVAPTPPERLDAFYRAARPVGFWGPVAARNPEVATGIERGAGARVGAGLLAVYGTLFGLGGWLLGSQTGAWFLLFIFGMTAFVWLLKSAREEPDDDAQDLTG
jgi:hypothetical protein